MRFDVVETVDPNSLPPYIWWRIRVLREQPGLLLISWFTVGWKVGVMLVGLVSELVDWCCLFGGVFLWFWGCLVMGDICHWLIGQRFAKRQTNLVLCRPRCGSLRWSFWDDWYGWDLWRIFVVVVLQSVRRLGTLVVMDWCWVVGAVCLDEPYWLTDSQWSLPGYPVTFFVDVV